MSANLAEYSNYAYRHGRGLAIEDGDDGGTLLAVPVPRIAKGCGSVLVPFPAGD